MIEIKTRGPLLTVTAAVSLLIPVLTASAQSNKLYLTNRERGGEISIVQSGQVISKNAQTPTNGNAYALAVAGNVRTFGNLPTSSGSEYNLLTGASVGSPYFRTPNVCCFYDGTTDGSRYNYAVTHNETAIVYRFDRNWSNPTVVFSLAMQSMGITYDLANNSLWLGSWRGDAAVYQYSLTGTLLSSFSLAGTGFTSARVGSLAYNPVDQSLWMSSYRDTPGRLYQYSRAGTLLSTVDVAIPSGQNTPNYFIGGEFEMVAPTVGVVPEPATLALFGAGLLGVVGLARRKRAA